MKHIKSLLFIVPAAVFAGMLCYSGFMDLSIYIPQERERRSFVELKKTVQTATAQAEQGEEAEAEGSGSPRYPTPTTPWWSATVTLWAG